MIYISPGTQSAKRGDIIITVLIFAAVTVTIVIGLLNWGATMLNGIRTVASKEQAFQIAEAGVDYYQWHLAQSPADYTDGTTTAQPYVHKFYNRDGDLLGTYSLTITPPLTGSTIVKITSVGTLASSSISRRIQETLAIPSLAKYAVVANDNMNFGSGTTVNGPVQSNKGIHFDGVANNLVSSALSTYTDPDATSCTTNNSWAVHTCVSTSDPASPTAYATHADVFKAGRQLSVPAFDFTSLTSNLAQLQTLAQTGGKEWTHIAGTLGYHIVFKVVGGVTYYDMYKVTAIQPTPTGGAGSDCGQDTTALAQVSGPTYYRWGTWTIKNLVGAANPATGETLLNTGTGPGGSWVIPANGVIFVDDDLWVDGTIDNARITIAAGIVGSSNPSLYSNITINTNLKYTNTNGADTIGLIAQGNINSGMVSDNIYEIDGALVAMNGRVGRFYYNGNCDVTVGVTTTDYSQRSALTLVGMIATAVRYGFAYSDNTGYVTRDINYDANLLYGPPPSFPQATTQYQVISWQQLQ